MRWWTICVACCLGVLLGVAPGEAGIRAPGKYCGVVVFDRWDGCTLYSGIYVMYVSEKTKEGLRRYAGQCVQIDAKEVDQPFNPGDGLIGKFEYLGAAAEKEDWAKLKGIALKSSVKVDEDGKAVATITMQNKGTESVKVFSQRLALTLLVKRDMSVWSVSDGPSFALITRQSFEIGGSSPRWQSKGVREGKPYFWTIGKENALPHDFTLAPKERREIDVQFELPDGQYDFLCGYGAEGKCLASNLAAFDVEDGKAKVVKIKGRKGASSLHPNELVCAAHETYAAYVRAVRGSSERMGTDIPSAYWAEDIKALRPIRVYTHRINIVVVQQVADGTEQGKYIFNLVSSYLPQSGDDGFEFTPNPRTGNRYSLGSGVFDYKRTRGN